MYWHIIHITLKAISPMTPSLQNFDLSGKTVLVTGGGRGIGRVMALHLAASGARVAVAARSESELQETAALIQSQGGDALIVPLDVTDWAGVQAGVEAVNRAFGQIDILVNNAGIFGPIGPAWEADPSAWWNAINVNLHGAFLLTRAVLPGMVERGQGRIINLASTLALRPNAYATAYATAKAALVHFTGCLALETAGKGVSVFAMHPGTVLTDMTRDILDTEAGQSWLPRTRTTFDEGRNLPPERAAELVVCLASGYADRLSGRFIMITDDIAKLVREAEEDR
jgi:NAD(P)-dependent dehydrogenase (short-subunit alcohol dehydrogenase family)